MALAPAPSPDFDPAHRLRVQRQGIWAIRSCMLAVAIVFVVLPAAGVGLAIWLFWSSIEPEAAAAAAYRSAPTCSSIVTRSCVVEDDALLLSLEQIPGRYGSHTDRLRLQLWDGVHEAEIAHDVLAPYDPYGTPSGIVHVREYRGLVTTVFTRTGKSYETTDSPAGGASYKKGTAVVLAGFLVPWLLLVAVFILKNLDLLPRMWRLLIGRPPD